MYFTQPHCACRTRFNTPESSGGIPFGMTRGAPIGQKQRTKFSIYGLFVSLIPSSKQQQPQSWTLYCRAHAHCSTVSQCARVYRCGVYYYGAATLVLRRH